MIQLLLILIINSLVLIAWGKYLHHLDAFTSDKKNDTKLFWLIIAGGIPSIALTLYFQPFWEGALYNFTGLWYGMNPIVANILIVGPVEELSKFLTFIFLTSIMKSIKEPRDAVIQAASVALGFALVENILYAWSGGLLLLVLRSFITIVGHMTYAAIWGFAWGAFKYSSVNSRKTTDRYFIIPSLILSAIFHGLYNSLLDYNHIFMAFSSDFITIILVYTIYHYVRDNSPYRNYSLKEYRTAIPVLKKGLNKYPKSYELNKRMGIFQIYAQKYRLAEKFLKIAHNLKPSSPFGKFYYGLARYLNGYSPEGIRLMNRAVSELPASLRIKHVSALKKIVSDEHVRKKLITAFNTNNLQFESAPSDPGTGKKRKYTSGRYRPDRKKSYTTIKQYRSSYSYSYSKHRGSNWDRLVRVNPDSVIPKPYKILRNSVVNRDSEYYNEILDKKVAELKKLVKR